MLSAVGFKFLIISFFEIEMIGRDAFDVHRLLVGALIKPDIAETQTESVRVNQFYHWTPKHQMMKRVQILNI